MGRGEVRGEVRERAEVGCVLDGMSQECVELVCGVSVWSECVE